jgi:hypothetical protein
VKWQLKFRKLGNAASDRLLAKYTLPIQLVYNIHGEMLDSISLFSLTFHYFSRRHGNVPRVVWENFLKYRGIIYVLL